MMPWRAFAARTVFAAGMVGVAVFAGMRLATADPGGPTRPSLTFSGVLRNTDGSAITTARSASLTFSFTKPGAPVCTTPAVATTIAAGGAFSVLVSIDGCGSSFFDGSNITYTVSDGADVLTPTPQAITPVPYARFADQAGVNNDCPAGFARAFDPSAGITDTPGSLQRLCQRTRSTDGVVYDEVVRVGSGGSAFWIDRFEATIWQDSQGTRGLLDSPTVPYGTGTAPDYPAGFPPNGQWAVPPTAVSRDRTIQRLYALSRGAMVDPSVPSRSGPSRFMTWFQAQATCRASGKRLPTGDEWLEAAVGTDDGGGTSNGGDRRCVTSGTSALPPGRDGCKSVWGAWDMIGNVAEWTAEWFASVGQTTRLARSDAGGAPATSAMFEGEAVLGIRVNSDLTPWGGTFGGDGTYNVTSTTEINGRSSVVGMPAAAIRGGYWGAGSLAGVFALDLGSSPASWGSGTGFRCVVPR